jgi:hypothetical protein
MSGGFTTPGTRGGWRGRVAGVNAGSIALVGWALGSGIEGLASVIVIQVSGRMAR